MSSHRVALVTCGSLRELNDDDRPLLLELWNLGITAEPAVWDDPSVAWGSYDAAVIRSAWDYHLTPAAHLIDEALALIGCTVVPTGVGNTDTQVLMARTLGATGYVGTPSFLMTILKRAAEMGGGRLPIQVAQVGAEPFPESMRRTFQEEYGIIARQGFGTADLGMIAYECGEARGMHLVEDVVLQVCDPQSGEPLADGQLGEMVATVRHETYPMIRFGTGDLTVVDGSPCPCGRTSARMLGWRGRADEVTKVRGMFIHPRQVDETVARAGITASRAQAVVTRAGHEDELTLRVELPAGADTAAATAALTGATRDVMKLRVRVEVVPAGAIPKDGPSAGITMAVALYSLAVNKPVKKMVAMTGELSLTGRVMPIGGVKEKTIAAKRAKIVELIFPEENKKDFDELPAHIRKGLKPQFVSTFKQAVNLCF